MKDKAQMWQAIKFTLFSISAGVIQIGSFAILELFIEGYWIPYLTSLLLSILWNFTLNRRYTFKSAANVPVAMAKVLGFYAVFTPLSTWLGNMAAVAGAPEFLVLGITMLANFVLEFLFCKFVVYRGQENTREEHVKHTECVEVIEGSNITVKFNRPTALQIDGETILGVTEYTARV